MLWYLVFHIIGFIFWVGALLDVSRILGYHTKEELNVQERLSRIEFRIFWFVATPGMVITVVFGLLLLMIDVSGYFVGKWMHIKLSAVLVLMILHAVTGVQLMKLKKEPRIFSPARFKAIHGICGLIVTTIIIMVVVKPF